MSISISREVLGATDFTDIDTGAPPYRPHPGEILREEFMAPRGLSSYALAKAINVPANRITGIIHGDRGITADTAIRLGEHFGTSAEMWMNLQVAYALAAARAALRAA